MKKNLTYQESSIFAEECIYDYNIQIIVRLLFGQNSETNTSVSVGRSVFHCFPL